MVDMCRYSQNDPRWKFLEYAGGETFGRNGCLVCSVAMVGSLAYAEELTPVDVAYHLRKAGAFRGGVLSYPERIPVAFERLGWDGPRHYRNVPADMDAIAAELSQYRATIAEVKWDSCRPLFWTDANGVTRWNQHFVVLTALEGSDARVIDPWDGEEKLLSKSRYRLPQWDAARTIYGVRLVRAI